MNGSYHKISKGYNSHKGYHNLVEIVIKLITIVEKEYNIILPTVHHWFIQRIDIAICFDLETQENVKTYINNLSHCNYPRRKIKVYQDESIYLSGTTTTVKIYNKLLEFKKHDMKKFYDTKFELTNYLREIEGFVRFECEIKKKKLKDYYKKQYVRVVSINYKDLKEIWREDFMKFLKMFDSELTKVRNKEDVKRRLNLLYKKGKANKLCDFYMAILQEGLDKVKERTCKSSYYRNVKELKSANIDFTQNPNIEAEKHLINFNPFEYKEVM